MSGWVLILGAKSDIARAIAHRYAKAGYSLYLAARNYDEPESDITDINIRYKVQAKAMAFDVTDFGSHESFYKNLDPKPDGVICAVGFMPEQKDAQADFEIAKRVIDANYTGCVSILEIIAGDFEERKSGFIIGISSAAGDRGRKKNYTYGSAKAGFTAFLSGLRNRLFGSGVHVMTVKPGFVATRMTRHMDLPEKLTAQPTEVAEDIFRAHQKGKDVLYTKWFWKLIMWIIIHVPEKIFKRTTI